ncbi:MAG: helix-turn-helix domain-containing protein [Burkholderiales bacterium]|jgi:CheY-like chemotaxis protein
MPTFSDHDALLYSDTDPEDSDDHVSLRVRNLLTKRGVPIHKQGSELSHFLGVARSTIHRKFKNGGWSAAELRAVAEHWRCDLDELLGVHEIESGQSGSSGEISAKVLIKGMPSQAVLLLGFILDPDGQCDLVAVNPAGHWEVYIGGSEPQNIPRYSVRKLTFSAHPYMRIALLEDNQLAADALAEELTELGGVSVHKFYRAHELIASFKHRRFDAYVVDWLLGGGETAEATILAIRNLQKKAPIIVTTGALALQADTEQHLLPFCEQHQVGIIEKKFRAAVLLSQLRRDLAAAAR